MKKNFFLGLALIFCATSAMAAKAPVNWENLLWNVSGEIKTGEARHICMTTKLPPFNQILCVGEMVNVDAASEGFAVLKNKEEKVVATYKVTPVGKWLHLYRTTEYVSNTDFYTRTLKLTDSSNNSSIITETFAYSDEQDNSEKDILTINLTGSLPDGSRIALDNGFYFYGR
jgi:hypothetical protein